MIKRVAIIAGETSGDILGSRLIAALKALNPEIQFEGIGGKEMQKQGCDCLYPMEKLAVMGFTEVISHLPELLKIRKTLINRWLDNKPDLVIGIDAPDFNLKLESILHQAGIAVAHYVSPSVWAWRSKRVQKMKGNLDLMLTLFPFEADFYRQHDIPVEFVGHPLADEVPLLSDKQPARKQLGLSAHEKILAILPGSRASEIKYLAPHFIKVAQHLQKEDPELRCVAPMVNDKIDKSFRQQCKELAPSLVITIVKEESRKVMAASDAILMASGTAVLEGMFVGRPMVAAGKLSPITVWLVRTFGGLNVTYYTLPNNLADEELVAEFIQEEVSVDNILPAVKKILYLDSQEKADLLVKFNVLHQRLRKNASATAAKVLAEKFALIE